MSDTSEYVTVKMIKDDRAAPEGHTVIDYKAGEEYVVPAFVADAFLANESAEQVGAAKAPKKKAG